MLRSINKWRFGMAVGYTLIIVYFSLIDLESLGTNSASVLFIQFHMIGEGFIVHLIAYSVMGYLWKYSGLSSIKSFLISFLTGAFIEIAQNFTSTRILSLSDNLANALGSLCGIIIYLYFKIPKIRLTSISKRCRLIT